jgi:hypothetical protein
VRLQHGSTAVGGTELAALRRLMADRKHDHISPTPMPEVRDEEAAGSNPVTPTHSRRSEACAPYSVALVRAESTAVGVQQPTLLGPDSGPSPRSEPGPERPDLFAHCYRTYPVVLKVAIAHEETVRSGTYSWPPLPAPPPYVHGQRRILNPDLPNGQLATPQQRNVARDGARRVG